MRAQSPTMVEASEGMTPYEKQLFGALRYLSTALDAAAGPNSDSDAIRDPAVVDILSQSASILDRMSTPASLAIAIPMFMKLHEYYASQVSRSP